MCCVFTAKRPIDFRRSELTKLTQSLSLWKKIKRPTWVVVDRETNPSIWRATSGGLARVTVDKRKAAIKRRQSFEETSRRSTRCAKSLTEKSFASNNRFARLNSSERRTPVPSEILFNEILFITFDTLRGNYLQIARNILYLYFRRNRI